MNPSLAPPIASACSIFLIPLLSFTEAPATPAAVPDNVGNISAINDPIVSVSPTLPDSPSNSSADAASQYPGLELVVQVFPCHEHTSGSAIPVKREGKDIELSKIICD
ncbi:unnamed protein product [Cutaneotrichosporon oleaginosum]